MENPHLIEEISNLAKGQKKESEKPPEIPPLADESTPEAKPASAPIASHKIPVGGKNRSQLLGALKPYVSVERAQAIDSMLSIVEILDAMKGR